MQKHHTRRKGRIVQNILGNVMGGEGSLCESNGRETEPKQGRLNENIQKHVLAVQEER